MINLEAHDDGFSVVVNGRKLLCHNYRRPLLEMGKAGHITKRKSGFLPPKEHGKTMTKAREWKLLASKEDFLDIDFVGLCRMILKEQDGALQISFFRYDSTLNRFLFRLASSKEEAVFGCAYSSQKPKLKGQRLILWNGSHYSEKKHRSMKAATHPKASLYRSKPAFVTSTGRFVKLQTNAYCVFDFKKTKSILLCSWAIPEEIIIGYELDMAAAIRAQSFLSEPATRLPDWVWDGAWLGVKGGIKAINDTLETMHKSGARVSAIIIEDLYGNLTTAKGMLCRWDWRLNSDLYPNLAEEIAGLKRKGIRVFGYINHCLDIDSRLYPEASGLGFMVKNEAGSDYIIQNGAASFALLDLFNPDAFSWIKRIIKKELLDSGMSGWIADMGDILPTGAVFHGCIDSSMLHNGYADRWALANREAIIEAGKEKEAIFLMASGWTRASSLASSFFSKPQEESWNKKTGLPGLIPAAISMGFSGDGLWLPGMAADSKLAKKTKYKEYLIRRMELSVFSPIFMINESIRIKKSPGQWSDQELTGHFARLSHIWSDMAPYHAETMDAYIKDGLPPIRHCWIHYEEERQLMSLDQQYMYGRDILVAPVLEQGKELAKAVLPNDRWVHLWTSRTFGAGELLIEAPLGYPPVFYRACSEWAGLFEGLRRSARQKARL
ncbi:sulfoquinovosidase [Spirochaetota bacterium]